MIFFENGILHSRYNIISIMEKNTLKHKIFWITQYRIYINHKSFQLLTSVAAVFCIISSQHPV